MFDKFGELNSYKEINELAENLLNEGDIDSIQVMAEENGIEEDYVTLYCRGDIPTLCDAATAAWGKIGIEAEELKPKEIMADWMEYLKAQCMEDEALARQVRRKGKSLKGCIGALLAWSFQNQQDIGKDILKAAGVKTGKVTLGIPGMKKKKKIIRAYYTEG